MDRFAAESNTGAKKLQQPALGSKYVRDRCTSTTKLETKQQLCKCTIRTHSKNFRCDCNTMCSCDTGGPLWKGQQWFNKLSKLLVSPPLRIPNNRRNIINQVPWNLNVTQEPPKNPKWKLYVWRLCGDRNCMHWDGVKNQQVGC